MYQHPHQRIGERALFVFLVCLLLLSVYGDTAVLGVDIEDDKDYTLRFDIKATPDDALVAFSLCSRRAYVNKSNPEHCLAIIIMKGEEETYPTLVRRYCWQMRLDDQSCDRIIVYAGRHIQNAIEKSEEEVSTLGAWGNVCVEMKLDEAECQRAFRHNFILRPLDFITPYEDYLGGYSGGLTGVHIDHLRDFVKLLTDQDCTSHDASSNLRRYMALLGKKEQQLWSEPARGVYRDSSRSLIPCDDRHWAKGYWQPRPMWGHSHKELALTRCPSLVKELTYSDCSRLDAIRGRCEHPWYFACPEFLDYMRKKRRSKRSHRRRYLETEISASDGEQAAAGAGADGNGVVVSEEEDIESDCVAVSLFSGSELRHEIFMSALGCSVTAQNMSDMSESVSRTKAHLSSSDGKDDEEEHVVGDQQDEEKEEEKEFLPLRDANKTEVGSMTYLTTTLNAILSEAGLANRTVDLLKIDCGGCEWNVLHQFVQENSSSSSSPSSSSTDIDRTCNIFVHAHVSRNRGMDTYTDLVLMAEFWRVYIVERGFKVWYLHRIPGPVRDRIVHPILKKMGLPSHYSSYEIALYRPGCLAGIGIDAAAKVASAAAAAAVTAEKEDEEKKQEGQGQDKRATTDTRSTTNEGQEEKQIDSVDISRKEESNLLPPHKTAAAASTEQVAEAEECREQHHNYYFDYTTEEEDTKERPQFATNGSVLNRDRFPGFSYLSLKAHLNEASDSTRRFPGRDAFAGSYRDVAFSGRTVGIVQFDYLIHSEVVGPLVDLCRDAGFKHVIVYHESFFKQSSWLNSMLPFNKGWDEWDKRPAAQCWADAHEWDILLMVTGTEAYQSSLSNAVYNYVRLLSDRIVAIQHHQFWVVRDVFPHFMMLTPWLGRHKWIFPLITPIDEYAPSTRTVLLPPATTATATATTAAANRSTQHANNDEDNIGDNYDGTHADADAHTPPPASLFRRTLLLLGDIPTPEPGNIHAKNKDLDDMERFLNANSSHFLVAMAREENMFVRISSQFPNQTHGLWGLSSADLLDTLLTFPILWMPITRDSAYANGVFTSTIAFGLAYRRTMVMPRYVSELYDLSGAVVEYDSSVLEIDFDRIDHIKLRERMDQWEKGRRMQNTLNFLECITTACD